MSMSQSRRRKLELLTRSLVRRDFVSAAEVLAQHGHAAINRPRDEGPPARAEAGPVDLAAACPGLETPIQLPGGPGKCYLVRRRLGEIAGEDLAIARDYAAVLRGAGQRVDELEASPGLCHAANATPEQVLFLDTETCGLAGNMIFLMGLMFYREGQLLFEQYLARDYSEEAAVLQAFGDKAAEAGVLVTFNGKAFDVSLIRERAAFHALELGLEALGRRHVDLLHESRKRWRGKLPNCRLQTLERYFCRRVRMGDIPGSAIPDAYHRFVQSGDARQMGDILHHNLLDLLTMAQVLCLVLTGADPTA